MSPEPKVYILDTSVLLHRPEALYSFGINQVVIPIVVLDELDDFKRGSLEINRNARRIISMFDELRNRGHLFEGVTLDNGGTLLVDTKILQNREKLLPAGFQNNADNHILASGVRIKDAAPERKVVLVSKDINMRVKAEALGLLAEDYRADQLVEPSEMYTGHAEITVSQELIDRVYREKTLIINGSFPSEQKLYPNQFLMLVSQESPSVTALGRFDGQRFELLRDPRHDIWGIRPLNREQRYALDVLLDDDIPLVTLAGKAGTGKTILAIAAGLQKVVNDKTHRRLSVYRPVVPMGRDIGYLPGSEQEKLAPWMQPIFDNLEFLLNEGERKPRSGGSKLDYLMDSNVLDIRALTYIRGRSLPHQFIIVDESQNLTPHEVKTIITRAGHGTKLILTGDPYQIDSPYLDCTSNGLTHVVERFRGEKMAAHVTLIKGERSPLAELASTIMEQ